MHLGLSANEFETCPSIVSEKSQVAAMKERLLIESLSLSCETLKVPPFLLFGKVT